MSDKKLDYKITEEYIHELNEISNKLNQLSTGQISELSGHRLDGCITTNIGQLRKMINELLGKIQSGKKGTATELSEAMNNIHI